MRFEGQHDGRIPVPVPHDLGGALRVLGVADADGAALGASVGARAVVRRVGQVRLWASIEYSCLACMGGACVSAREACVRK